jgi:hypothetical protein
MSHRLVLAISALLIVFAGPVRAQAPRAVAAAMPGRFESWRPVAPVPTSLSLDTRFVPAQRHRGRNALLGGAIGAAAGVVFCTAVSTLANDSADGGLSFCPLDSYLLIGGAGFAVGFAIGWLA